MRAFERPLADVRVLVVGQDPYPTPGHPVGLSFAVAPDVRPIPRSLANIDQELETDLGLERAAHGDLTAWADQGVMLLNRVLTVRPGASDSHQGKGWEDVTDCAILRRTVRLQERWEQTLTRYFERLTARRFQVIGTSARGIAVNRSL